jgi:hypothetical protein
MVLQHLQSTWRIINSENQRKDIFVAEQAFEGVRIIRRTSVWIGKKITNGNWSPQRRRLGL